MKHEPPVPEGNRSPYPLKEAPHDHAAQSPATTKGGKHSSAQSKAAGSRSKADGGASSGRTLFGIGAAVALGAGATVAAFLFARRPKATGARKSKATAAKKGSGKRTKRSA